MNKKSNKKNYYGKSNPMVVQGKGKMTDKKKNILAYILAGLMIIWTVCSVLGTIGFFKSNKASAEEVSTVPSNTITDDGWVLSLDYLSGIRLSEQYSSFVGSLSGPFTLEFQRKDDYLIFTTSLGSVSWSVGSHTQYKDIRVMTQWYDEFHPETVEANFNTGNLDFIYNSYPRTLIYRYSNSFFVFDVDFADNITNEIVGTLTFRFSTNFINYTVDEYRYPFDNRGIIDVTDNFTQDIKFLPYNYADNFLSGYEQGYNTGHSDGYGAGYSDGVNEANDYSFGALMSSVLDSQVSFFTGLFDFDLLGVNLSSFFLALLTVCFIVTIVKLLI